MSFWIDCIATGILLAFVAAGYSLIYGVLRFVNFAFSDVLGVSALVALQVCSFCNSSSLFLALISGVICGGSLSLLMERLFYRPFRRFGPMTLLLSSFAVSALVQSFSILFWGASSRGFPVANPVLEIGELRVYSSQLWLCALALVVFGALGYLLKSTLWGLSIRGFGEHSVQVAALGIKVDRNIAITFLISGMLGGLAGVLLATTNGASPTLGFRFGIWAFAATLLGGLGSLRKAMLGGVALGVVLSVCARFLSVLYSDAVAFGIIGIALLIRPVGLLGLRQREF